MNEEVDENISLMLQRIAITDNSVIEEQRKLHEDEIKRKNLEEAVSSLNLKDDRLFLACKSCHGLKPMIIVELGLYGLRIAGTWHFREDHKVLKRRDDSSHCKLCGAIARSVLLHEAVLRTGDADQTFIEYTVVREPRSSDVEEDCKFTKRKLWGVCPDGENCKYVHNAMERKVWHVVKARALKWTFFSQYFSQDDVATTAWFHCPICSVNLETGLEFSTHCDTRSHKKLSKTIKHEQNAWKYRNPPDLHFAALQFELCSCVDQGTECDKGDQCPHAHSKEELKEWKAHLELLKEKLKFAKDNALMSFADQINEEYAETTSAATVLTDKIPGVKWSASPSTMNQQCGRHSKFEWQIKLESEDPQKKLSHVAFLQRSGQSSFKICCVRGNQKSDFTSHIDYTAATDDRNNLFQGKAKFKVKFSSPHCGSYQDYLVIEFRDAPRPALMIKFHVTVNLMNSINLNSIVTRRPKREPNDNWEKNRKIVRYEESFSTTFSKTVAELSLKYKPPDVALDYDQSLASNDLSSDFESRELTSKNYVAMMHSFLYKEEAARSKEMAKLRSTCDIALSDNYFSSHAGLQFDDGKGNLFGIFQVPSYLDTDSDEGMLVLENCVKVLIALEALGPNAEVYEAKIEEISSEHVVLKLSVECVKQWQLKSGILIRCGVRFLLDRRVLCMCHCALDLLEDRVNILCPDPYFAEKSSAFSRRQQIFPYFHPKLDSDQMKALHHMMGDHPPLPLFTLLGPFGTGKTHAISECVKHLLEHVTDVKILICTHSNSAADLYIENNFVDSIWKGKIIRVYYHDRKLNAVPGKVRQHCLIGEDYKFRYPETHEILSRNVKVVVTTFSTALVLGQKGTGLQGVFTHIFLDEGAQALEAEAIIPLTLAVTKQTKVIVAGDHLQISPKIYCKKFGSEGKFTLVERMYAKYKEFKNIPNYQPDRIYVFLRNNYRCVAPILDLIQETFYKKGLLTSRSKEVEIRGVDPVQFLHFQGVCLKDDATGGFYNDLEAQVVVSRAIDLVQNYSVEEKDIAIVATYHVQVKLIRDYLRKNRLWRVDAQRARNIQGREYKIVILSCVHRRLSKDDTSGTNSGFLSNVGLLNTAITRSKVAVMAVGDAVTLCSLGECQHRWNVFINTCYRRGTIVPDNRIYPEIRRRVAEFSGLNPEARRFVPKGVHRSKTPQSSPKYMKASSPQDELDVDPPTEDSPPVDDADSDSDSEDAFVVDDEILNDILEKEFGAKLDAIRMKVDREGLEYLDAAEDPNEIGSEFSNRSRWSKNRRAIHSKFTLEQLQNHLENKPESFKRCLLDMKWWHTAEAILKQPENGLTKILLPTKRSIGRAFDKDEVVVRINKPMHTYDPQVTTTGVVVGVLSRYKDPRTREFVCIPDRFNPSNQMCPVDQKTTKFQLFNYRDHSRDEIAIFEYKQKKLRKKRIIRIDPNNVHGYGKLFIVRFLCWNEYCPYPLGYVCDVLKASEAEKYYTITCDVPPQHKPAMEKIAEKLTDQNSKIREDCTNLYVFTIDPLNSTDLDDALSIEKCGDQDHENCYRIGVHIADVASVIPENSKIDAEAKRRATTFYVPEIARNENRSNSPMLPRALSSDKCSLLRGKTRPTISMFFHTSTPPAIGVNGVEHNIPVPRLTKICSQHQFTYRDAEIYLRQGKQSLAKHFDIASERTLPQQMYQIWQFVLQLRQTRLDCAVLSGEPDFDKYRQFCDEGLAHILIEEAMITLNACSAIFMKNKRCNFLLRCQDPPLDDEWMLWARRFQKQINLSLRQQSCLNYLRGGRDLPAVEPQKQQRLVEIYSHVWSDIGEAVKRGDLESALLLFCCDILQPGVSPAARGFIKIQQRATLKPFNCNEMDMLSHFSLRTPFYSWCSSPIRRYPDITSQRAIISKIKNPSTNHNSDVIVLESRKEEQNLRPICKLIAQRQHDAKDYERGMVGFALAVLLEKQQERSYQQAVITEVTSREIAFTSVSLKDLQQILMPLKYRDLMSKKSKPEFEEGVPPVLGQKILQQNQLTWNLKYYAVGREVSRNDHVTNYWKPMGVRSDKWMDLVSSLNSSWESNTPLTQTQLVDAERCLRQTFRSRQVWRKCPRRTDDDVGPCDRPECDRKDSPCSDYMSFQTKNLIKHGRVIVVTMKPGASILVQLHPTIFRGLMKPAVQLLCIADDLDICVEHQSTPVETFAADAKPNPLQKNYGSLRHYASSWLPVVRLDGVYCAVGDRNSATLAGVEIDWDPSRESGKFVLDRGFCDVRLFDIIPNDFLCIRVHGVQSKQNNKHYTWVAHAVVVETEESEEKDSRDNSSTKEILFELCEPIPPFKKSKPSDEVVDKLATVECIQLSIPHRRIATAMMFIRGMDHPPAIIRSLCLGTDLHLKITQRKKIVATEKVLETLGTEPLRGFSHLLNEGQIEEVHRAMGNKITLIQGPPGTGKSFLGAHLVYYFHQVNRLLSSRKKILYCGPSNKSVDVVAGYLLKCGLKILRVYGKTMEELAYPNPLMPALGNRSVEKPVDQLKRISLHEKIRLKSNTHHARILEFDKRFRTARTNNPVSLEEYKSYAAEVKQAKAEELQRHDIIVCTCTAAAGGRLREQSYSHCIIDEAGMCSEPETIVPVVTSHADQVVLIGDHKQLQPVIQCEKAKDLGLKYSKFERLEEEAGMLTRQYRMHESICAFPSMQFYEGRLETDISVYERPLGVLRYPSGSVNTAIFAHIVGEEDSSRFDRGGENSKYNDDEARAVIRILVWLHYTKRVELRNIMILSPYSAQCEAIKRLIGKERSQLEEVHVGTVVTSQGSERDYVILSTVRSQRNELNDELPSTLHWRRKYLGFVTDPHQINVAITRAKLGLCIVGNRKILSKDMDTWEKLLKDYEAKGSVVSFRAPDAPWNVQ